MSWESAMDRARRASVEWTREEGAEKPEPVYRYVIELDCAPSTFDAIAEAMRSLPTANRKYRYYPKGDSK